MLKHSSSRGFTLLEILLVVGIIAILAGIVIVAINPGKQLADARNARRKVDIQTILNGVYQYAIDTSGTLPTAISTTVNDICHTGGTCTGLVDLGVLTLNEKYLTSIPVDPSSSTANNTGYRIVKSANGRVTVSAPAAEQGETISATR